MTNYITKSDLEGFLQTTFPATVLDSTIQSWIDGAEARANSYMGYTTASGMWMEVITDEMIDTRVDADGNLLVFPRKLPIDSITSLAIVQGLTTINLSVTDGNGNARYNIPSSKDYIFFPGSQLAYSSSYSATDFYSVKYSTTFTKLSYRAGYTVIPEDVKLAVENLAADTAMRYTNKEGLQSLTQGRITKSFFDRATKGSSFVNDAFSILQGYRMATRWI